MRSVTVIKGACGQEHRSMREWMGCAACDKIEAEAARTATRIRVLNTQAQRCGSFPYLYIAQDFALPYAAVLNYSDGMAARHSVWSQRAADEIMALLSDEAHLRFRAAVYRQVIGAGDHV